MYYASDLYLKEVERLEEICWDLDEVLSCIAFAGKANDRRWIAKRQRGMKRLHGPYLDKFKGSEGHFFNESEGLNCILDAYDLFMGLLDDVDNYLFVTEYIREEAENILYEYILIPEEQFESV